MDKLDYIAAFFIFVIIILMIILGYVTIKSIINKNDDNNPLAANMIYVGGTLFIMSMIFAMYERFMHPDKDRSMLAWLVGVSTGVVTISSAILVMSNAVATSELTDTTIAAAEASELAAKAAAEAALANTPVIIPGQ